MGTPSDAAAECPDCAQGGRSAKDLLIATVPIGRPLD